MRAILGILAGIIIAFSISPCTNQGTILGIIIIMSILFYIISYWISKKILPNVPKTEKRKFVTNGIFPFIFLPRLSVPSQTKGNCWVGASWAIIDFQSDG